MASGPSRGPMLTACSQNGACDHAAAQQQQPDENPAAEDGDRQPRRQRLTDCHADERPHERDHRWDNQGAAEPVVETEPERHRQRRHKAEIANACTNSSLPRLSACTYGTLGTTKIPVAPFMCPVVRPISGPSRAPFGRDFEVDADEANQGIDHEDSAKQCGGQANIRLG